MSAWHTILLLAAFADAHIDLGERANVGLVVLTPSTEPLSLSSGQILEASAQAIEPGTGLRVRSSEQAGISSSALRECPADRRLACLVHLALGTSASGALRYLIVVTVLPTAGSEELSALLLDLDRSTAIVGEDLDADAMEQALYDRAEHAPAIEIARADIPGWTRFFSALLGSAASEGRIDTQDMGQRGSISIESWCGERTLTIDGERAGAVGPGSTRVENVKAGRRGLSFERPGLPAFSQVVDVQPGLISSLRCGEPPSGARTPLLIGSGAVLAAGAATLVWAALAAGSVDRFSCIQRGADDAACAEALSVPFGGYDEGPAIADDASHASGVPMWPIGVGLVAGASATGAAAWWWPRCQEEPWWCVGGGLIVGVLAGGLSALLSP